MIWSATVVKRERIILCCADDLHYVRLDLVTRRGQSVTVNPLQPCLSWKREVKQPVWISSHWKLFSATNSKMRKMYLSVNTGNMCIFIQLQADVFSRNALKPTVGWRCSAPNSRHTQLETDCWGFSSWRATDFWVRKRSWTENYLYKFITSD